MRELRGCKMSSLDMYRGMSRVLLGLLLLASCVPLVKTTDYSSLNATSSKLQIGDTLFSPNHYFELGFFNYSGTTPDSKYYLSIRCKYPIAPAVTWMANRTFGPLTSAAVLELHSTGSLQLSDSANNDAQKDKILYTFTDNMDVVSAQLLDTGNLVLVNGNGAYVWTSFSDTPPIDTLLPGQGMNRSKGSWLSSWQKSGDPAIGNDTYYFGWDAKGVVALFWICPKAFLNWRGGSYIPAPDVYAAHTIRNVDSIYFHALGHLYISSDPPTAILSGGPDPVNVTTLKRITIFPDGGLRIMHYTIHQPWSETLQLNESWKAVANWVVSDRPDSRSQCTTYGTCGQYSECVSLVDSPDPVTCQCPGQNNATTSTWFTPIDEINASNGCKPLHREQVTCTNGSITDPGNLSEMLVLNNTDMPWGGDYRNLTGNASVNCSEACWLDCYCAGAVYSKGEQMCWLKNGLLFNIGYPTVALHGTDRVSYLRNQSVRDYPYPRAARKDNKWVKILVPAVGIPGVLGLVAAGIFCLRRNEQVRQRVRACGSCFRRRGPAEPDVMVFQGPADEQMKP